MLVPPANKLILLIEDDADDERLTLRALRKNNVMNEVVVAYDGQEAIDFLHRTGKYEGNRATQYPALVILDLKLPKLSGIEVLQRIRANSNTQHIPVVVLTSSTDPSEIENCYSAGANSYVVKPNNSEEYIETVLNVVMYWLLLNHVGEPIPV